MNANEIFEKLKTIDLKYKSEINLCGGYKCCVDKMFDSNCDECKECEKDYSAEK
jgi:hypothetical protein